MSTVTTVQEKSSVAFLLQYEEFNRSLNDLIEKTTDFLSEKGPEWVKKSLEALSGFDRSLESMNLFGPFISKNLNNLLENIKAEMPLSLSEQDLFSVELFAERLRISIFNETCLGDEWFSSFKQ